MPDRATNRQKRTVQPPNRGTRRRMLLESLESRQLLSADANILHNMLLPADVDGNGTVQARDALVVINSIARASRNQASIESSASIETSAPIKTGAMPDVNGDGFIRPQDALVVINTLSRMLRADAGPVNSGVAEGEASANIDLAENNATNWGTFASDGAIRSVVDSNNHVKSGSRSILFTTASGFDTGLTYPAAANANWQLSDDDRLEYWGFTENSNIGWQHENYYVELISANGGRIEYRPTFQLSEQFLPRNGTFFVSFSLHGDAVWARKDFNNPNFANIKQVKFHFDTFDSGFNVYLDGVRFYNPLGYEGYDSSANDDNLIRNSSFEFPGTPARLPDAVDQILVLNDGSQAIADWEIFRGDASGTIDWVHEMHIDAGHGRLSIDLNGTPGFGGVRQRIATVPGVRYDLSFDLGGNPVGAFLPVPDSPLKAMTVRAAGQSHTFEHRLNASSSAQDAQWKTRRWSFVATDFETSLEFVGTGPLGSLYGAMLDNVHLTPSRNLVANGSFEEFDAADGTLAAPPTNSDSFLTLSQGSKAIASWEVIAFQPGDTIDWVHQAFWSAADGELSLDLNGTPGRGGVKQTIATEIGKRYELIFELAGNPLLANFDPNRLVRVTINGSHKEIPFVVRQGTTLHEPHWQQQRIAFTATASSTTIEFLDLPPTREDGSEQLGVVIDNVRVEASENLVANGGFEISGNPAAARSIQTGQISLESPSPSDPAQTVSSNAIAGWTSESISGGGGGVSFLPSWLHAVAMEPSEGLRSVELLGGSTVYQTLATRTGQGYLLSFDLGGVEQGVGAGDADGVVVRFGGQVFAANHFPGTVLDDSAPRWSHYEFVLNATSASTLLQFRTGSGNPIIDNVRVVSLDYGDAGGIYPTTFAANGARHLPEGPILGGRRDSEPDAESNDGIDEDGVLLPPLPVGASTTVTAIVTNPSLGAYAQPFADGTFLTGWIDFNNDGDWDDPSEKVTEFAVRAGKNDFPITVPSTVTANSANARFRISTQFGLGPTGFASNGEVEDYVVSLLPPSNLEGRIWNDINQNGVRDIVTIVGDRPEVVFIIDVSGSTNNAFVGTSNVGDQNNDGNADDILDGEIAGYIALNQHLIDKGFGTTGKVALVSFSSSAVAVDLNPLAAGQQLSTFPAADLDLNGELDIVQALKQLRAGGGTNFEAALDIANGVYDVLGTQPANGNLIFLSDGFPNEGGSYDDELQLIRSHAANVRAFGVGAGSSLDALRIIDSGASQFQSPNELVAAFSGLGGSTAFLEPGLPGWTVYIDANDNGVKDPTELSTLSRSDDVSTSENETGKYRFAQLPPGTYIIRQEAQSGWRRTFPVPPLDHHLVTTNFGQTISDLNFGNALGSVQINAVDDTFNVVINERMLLGVLDNDIIVDATQTSISSTTQPMHGTLQVDQGMVFYTPDLDYVGGDSFEYTISHSSGLQDTAVVTLNVAGSNLTSRFGVTNTLDSGPGSLRQAILDANAATKPSVVHFAIPQTDSGFVDSDASISGGDAGPDVYRIELLSDLPHINQSAGHVVKIDGRTQTSFADSNALGPEIELIGTSAGNSDGLTLLTTSEIYGLTINRFQGNGILVDASDVIVAGNYLGTDPTGTLGQGNGFNGIETTSSQRITIGGPNISDRNLLSGNDSSGLFDRFGSSDLVIRNNYVGTDRTGTVALSNSGIGLRLEGTTRVSVKNNLLSGNDSTGLFGHTIDDVSITGNLIGVNSAGTAAVGNSVHGIELTNSTDVIIGGPGAADRNLISGHSQVGIRFIGNNDRVRVENNYVGLNAAGTAAIANGVAGILIEGKNFEVIANVVSGNTGYGIGVFNNADAVNIQGNFVGTNAAGTAAIGNGRDGIVVAAMHVRIGGVGVGQRNLISGNGTGIRVEGSSRDVTITNNFIGTNLNGENAIANLGNGIVAGGESIRIGGAGSGEGNLVSGNIYSGIEALGGKDFFVSGNFVGTNATGTAAIANGEVGIILPPAAHDVVVGGDTAAHGNLVSGNSKEGIIAWNGYRQLIKNNRVGLNAAGNAAIPNLRSGILIQEGQTNVVDSNTVSGNRENGIIVVNSKYELLSRQWDTAVGGNGHYYVLLPHLDWNQSNELARSFGGQLTDIQTVAENDFIAANFGSQNPWIGLNDQANEGTFVWSSGIAYDPQVFNRFGPGEPNGQTRENTVQIYANGLWNDNSANVSPPSVAEFTARPDLLAIEDAISGVSISNNIVGLGADGALVVGNQSNGILIVQSKEVQLFDNTISANGRSGIEISESSEIELIGNFVGTATDGMTAKGNLDSGVYVHESSAVLIGNDFVDEGGNAQVLGNVISANGSYGILLDNVTNSTLLGNSIGTDATNDLDLGNGSSGVWVSDSQKIAVGFLFSGENRIAYNNGNGVTVVGNTSTGVTIEHNRIFNNDLLGIDLGNDGVTANDIGDVDVGPNGFQNKPLIHTVKKTTTETIVKGTVIGSPLTSFLILFSLDSNPASPQARIFFRFGVIVTSLLDGTAEFTYAIPRLLTAGEFVTATATLLTPDGFAVETSEFSTPASLATSDITRPTSRVNALPQRSSTKSFTVSVTGADGTPTNANESISGIKAYDVYVAEGKGAFTLWRTLPANAPSATFDGASNKIYFFRSLARDNAGNVEVKELKVEATTYVPDLDVPVTLVTTVASATPDFVVAFQGTDNGGSGLKKFSVFVSVDGATPVSVAEAVAGNPNGAGLVSGQTSYRAIADGVSHAYRFFTVGRDGNANVEAVPAIGDVTVTKAFAAAASLVATGLDVQKGAKQRSYIRNVDLQFNSQTGLQSLLNTVTDGNTTNDRITLKRFAKDGTGAGQAIALNAAILTRDGSKLAFDFAASGIGGNANSAVGDGYYEIGIDNDGNGTVDQRLHFYRLLGDSDGNRKVDNDDIKNVANAIRQPVVNLDSDLNGDGKVDATDRYFASFQRNSAISAGLSLDD